MLQRDDDHVVVDKPAGLVVHRGWANDDTDLLRLVRDALGVRVHAVHRLDRGTSGCTLFALHPEAAASLSRAFVEGLVDKRYLALVRGHPPEHVVVDHPVEKAPGGPKVPAVTSLRRLGVSGRYALCLARPHTGRLHQIRRHLKHLSCPLIGDVKYGKGEHNRLFRDEYGLHRLALHALWLEFPRPSDGRRVAVQAPLSGSLLDTLRRLGLPCEPEALNLALAEPF